jgi:hypothetical protein
MNNDGADWKKPKAKTVKLPILIPWQNNNNNINNNTNINLSAISLPLIIFWIILELWFNCLIIVISMLLFPPLFCNKHFLLHVLYQKSLAKKWRRTAWNNAVRTSWLIYSKALCMNPSSAKFWIILYKTLISLFVVFVWENSILRDKIYSIIKIKDFLLPRKLHTDIIQKYSKPLYW